MGVTAAGGVGELKDAFDRVRRSGPALGVALGGVAFGDEAVVVGLEQVGVEDAAEPVRGAAVPAVVDQVVDAVAVAVEVVQLLVRLGSQKASWARLRAPSRCSCSHSW